MVNRVHKRALRTIHENFVLTFDKLLQLDNSCTIHTKHLRTLMTVIYKSLNKANPQIMWDIFLNKKTNYNLRNKLLTTLPKARTTTFGTNSLVFKGSLIWNTLPNYFKDAPSLDIFLSRIKMWEGKNCSCRICI